MVRRLLYLSNGASGTDDEGYALHRGRGSEHNERQRMDDAA